MAKEKQDKSEFLSKYLQKLEKKNGKLTPGIVVENARPENSPIHSYFEWDDDAAADKYRLWQARQLIARVYIINDPKDEEDKLVKVRVFHSIDVSDDEEADENRQYMNIVKIMSDDQLKEKLLEDALRDASFFMAKYNTLKELEPLMAEIRKLVKGKKK